MANAFADLVKQDLVSDEEENAFSDLEAAVEDGNAFADLIAPRGQFLRSVAAGLPSAALQAGAGVAQAGADFVQGTEDVLRGLQYEQRLRQMRASGEPVSIFAQEALAQDLRKPNEFAEGLKETADTLRQSYQTIAKDYGVSDEYARSFLGQLGNSIGGAPTYILSALAGPAGIPVLLGAGYEEGAQEYAETVGESATPEESFSFAAPYALASAVLERIGVEPAIAKLMPSGKATVGQIIARLTGGAAAEGVTEASQGLLLDTMASLNLDDRDVITKDKLLQRAQEFAIGAIVGGGQTAVMQGVQSAISPKSNTDQLYDALDAEQPVVEQDSVAQPQQEQQQQVPSSAVVMEAIEAEPPQINVDAPVRPIDYAIPLVQDREMRLIEDDVEELDFLTAAEKTAVQRELQEELELASFIDEANREIGAVYEAEDVALTPAESELLEYEFRQSLNRLAKSGPGQTPVSQIDKRKDVLLATARGDKTARELNERLSKARQKIADIVARNEDNIIDLKVRYEQQLERQRTRAAEKLAEEVERRVRDIGRKFQERRNLENSIALLEGLVKQLPVQIRGRFSGFGTAAKIVGQDQQQAFLNKASEKVLNLMDDYTLRTNQRSLRDTVKRVRKNKKKAKELAIFDKVSEYANMPRDVAEEKAESLLAQPNITPDMAEEIFLLKTFGGKLNTKETIGFTGEEMRLAREEVEFMLREGRSRARARVEAERQRIEALRTGTINEVLGGDELKTQKRLEFNEEQKSVFRRVLDGLDEYAFNRLDGLETLLDNLRVKGERFRGFFQDAFFRPIFQAQMNVEQANTRDVSELGKFILENVIQDTGLRSKSKLATLLRSWGTKIDGTGIIYNHMGTVEEVPMSRWEAISMWMQWQDKSLAPTFEKMGITDETIQAVERFIGEDGIEAARYMLAQYKLKSDRLRKTVADVDGYIIETPENYSPIRRIVNGAVEDESRNLTDMNSFRKATEKNSSLIQRVSNVNELAFAPANEVFAQHAYEMNHYFEFARIAKDIRGVFGDEKVRRAIRQRTGGTDYLRLVDQMFDDIIRGGIDRAKYDKWANAVTSNLAVSSLAFNLTSAVKQLASIPAYSNEIPVKDFAKYIGLFWKNPLENAKTIVNTQYIQNRIRTSYDRDLRTLAEKGTNQAIRDVRSIRDRMMFLTRWGDLGAIIQGGWAVYQYHFDKAIRDGKTPEQAARIAEEEFSISTDRAQQSSQVFAQGYWQRGGSWTKLFTMYMTSPIQYQRTMMNAIKAWSTKRDGKRRVSTRDMLKTVFVYHVLLPQLFTAMGSWFIGLWGDDDEVVENFWRRQLAALVVGNFNALFMAGTAIQSIVTAVLEEDKEWMAESITIPFLDKMADLGVGITELSNAEDADEYVEGADKVLSAILSFGGVPYEPIKKQLDGMHEALTGDAEHPILRFFGFSDYALMTPQEDRE